MRFVLGLFLIVCSSVLAHDNHPVEVLKKNKFVEVEEYDLWVRFFPETEKIKGINKMSLKFTQNTDTLWVHLDTLFTLENLEVNQQNISNIIRRGKNIGVVYTFSSDSKYQCAVHYSGKPHQAKKAPWDGGVVWKKDSLQKHWAGVACQLNGAHLWWPNLDDFCNRPQKMKITLDVPAPYQAISNGKLHDSLQVLEEGLTYNRFIYLVSYPIVNYNVTFYIGQFSLYQNTYTTAQNKSLNIHFYYLPYQSKKIEYLTQQIVPMLKIYEELFGEYPFVNDGFKLIESPYLGMEHQSAIAYGNQYLNGYLGKQMKGIDFDYILIHETAHEYWGNHVTMCNAADMWIHEAFATYTEALFVEKKYDYQQYQNYMLYNKRGISNLKPIYGNPEHNQSGSSDMYRKGAWIIHGFRYALNDDALFFRILKNIQKDFAYQNVSTQEFIDYILKNTHSKFKMYWDWYVYQKDLPKLQLQVVSDSKVQIQWLNTPPNFSLPVYLNGKKINIQSGNYRWNTQDIQEIQNQINNHYLIQWE
jgi:aminopeptidase N